MSDLRTAAVAEAAWFVDNKGQIGYLEYRPFVVSVTLPFACDCSETCILILWKIGAAEPFPGAYSGLGNTESFLQLEHVSDPLPGDFVVYGEGLELGVQHMAIVVEGGSDPLTMSHGSPLEPGYVHVSEGCPPAALGRVTFVRCLPVSPPSPPEEDMKAYIATGSAGGVQIVAADCQTKHGVVEADVVKELLATGQFIDLRGKLDPAFVDSIPAS